jgi:radical SAM superfamily enzyme YgiQ (UPF0313 family)
LQIASATSGFKPVVLHAHRIGKDWADILPEYEAPLTGVSILTWNEWCRLPTIVADIKKKVPKTTIVVGGKYPTTYTKETLQIPGVDIVARGYADAAWSNITSNFSEGRLINNLEKEGVYRAGKTLPEKPNLTMSLPIPLKDLPQPAYGSLVPSIGSYINDDRYFDLQIFDEGTEMLMGLPFSPNVLSGLGCLWDCTFCMNTLIKEQNNFGRKPVELRPPGLIVEEIGILQQMTDLDEIPIFLMNPDSGYDPDHLVATVKEIEKQGIQAILGIDIRVHSLFKAISERPDLEMEKTLKDKLHKIILAPESLHPGTQITIGKETNPDELIATLHFCEQIDALPMVQIIVGFPIDSDDTLQYTLNTLLEIRDQSPPFILNVHRATPFPGTTMFMEAKQMELIEPEVNIPDLTAGDNIMKSQFLSVQELNNWRRRIVSEFYSREYYKRLMEDFRPLLRQEVTNSQRRGTLGEAWLKRK